MINKSTCFSISIGISCISRTPYKAMESSWYADKVCREGKSCNVDEHRMFNSEATN